MAGGAERADTVENALARVRDDVDFVAVHDAARPLLVKEWVDEVFAEQEETRVIRTENWVYFRRFAGGQNESELEDELYDVALDPSESIDLKNSPDHAAVATELAARIDRYFDRFSRPEADMWNGGRPVQNSMLPQFWRRAWGSDWHPVFTFDQP